MTASPVGAGLKLGGAILLPFGKFCLSSQYDCGNGVRRVPKSASKKKRKFIPGLDTGGIDI